MEKGDPAAQPQPNGRRAAAQHQQYAYDPRALLNPKSISKRPASQTDSDHSREDATIAGQVSLVERLHNVHERAQSPAKRVKTDKETKKTRPQSNMSGGSTLVPGSTNHQRAATSGAPPIDLTMSELLARFIMLLLVC